MGVTKRKNTTMKQIQLAGIAKELAGLKHIYNPSAKETIQAASVPKANEGAKGSLGLQRLTEAGAGGDKTITTQTAEKAGGAKKSAAELVRAQIAALEKEAAETKSVEK